jgi:hypothetical protein
MRYGLFCNPRVLWYSEIIDNCVPMINSLSLDSVHMLYGLSPGFPTRLCTCVGLEFLPLGKLCDRMSCCIFLRCRRFLADGSGILGLTHSRELRSYTVMWRAVLSVDFRFFPWRKNSFKLLSQIYNGAIGLSLYWIPNTFVAEGNDSI